MSKLRIKKGDTVQVISGRSKGAKGTVIVVNPAKDTVIIEGVNMVKCHTKPRRQGETGGIIEKEAAIRACKVALVCKETGKPTRVGFKVEDGKKIRISKKSGKEI
ncbi:MAG: 50S ribosomal protein L24 [Clostridia bacterium]